MMCADEYVREYYSIIASVSVDYEKQIVIIGIKSGM